MPVHRQKKDTTTDTPGSTQEQTAPPLPDQQAFHQHLRELARGAIRVVLEEVMREELDALIGVGWGESSPKRKGYRNGSYKRDLVTSTGRLEDIKVPRDREGEFHTQAFERYSRYEPHIPTKCATRLLKNSSLIGKRKLCRTGRPAREKWQNQRDRERKGQKMRGIEEKPGKKAMRLHSEQQTCSRRRNAVAAQAMLSRCQTERGGKDFWDAEQLDRDLASRWSTRMASQPLFPRDAHVGLHHPQ